MDERGTHCARDGDDGPRRTAVDVRCISLAADGLPATGAVVAGLGSTGIVCASAVPTQQSYRYSDPGEKELS